MTPINSLSIFGQRQRMLPTTVTVVIVATIMQLVIVGRMKVTGIVAAIAGILMDNHTAKNAINIGKSLGDSDCDCSF